MPVCRCACRCKEHAPRYDTGVLWRVHVHVVCVYVCVCVRGAGDARHPRHSSQLWMSPCSGVGDARLPHTLAAFLPTRVETLDPKPHDLTKNGCKKQPAWLCFCALWPAEAAWPCCCAYVAVTVALLDATAFKLLPFHHNHCKGHRAVEQARPRPAQRHSPTPGRTFKRGLQHLLSPLQRNLDCVVCLLGLVRFQRVDMHVHTNIRGTHGDKKRPAQGSAALTAACGYIDAEPYALLVPTELTRHAAHALRGQVAST
eukprot:366240-Chlamydomonas_euryale.AAC.4